MTEQISKSITNHQSLNTPPVPLKPLSQINITFSPPSTWIIEFIPNFAADNGFRITASVKRN